MNIFTILSMAVFPLYVFLGWYVYHLEPRARLNKIFLIFSGSFAIWAFTLTFFYNSADIDTAWLWYNLSALGRFFYPALLLNLALIFTENKLINRKWYYSIPLYIPGIIFLYAVFTGPFITQDLILINNNWYEILISSSWWYAYNLYYLLYVPLSFIIMGWWGYKSNLLREKKQALIIIITGAVAFSLGTISNTVMPLLDIYILPSMAQIFGVIFFLGIAYAIVNYKLLKLTPANAAEEIISKITDMIILMDPGGTIIKTNKRIENLLGYGKSEFEGKTWEYLVNDPNESAEIRKYLQDILNNQDKLIADCNKLDVYFQSKDGQQIPVKTFLSPINDDFGPIGVLLVGQDMRQTRELEHEIEERIKAQEKAQIHESKIRRSLQEKEILLKEIHHRVKNNMQIISSLLNLQSGYMKDKHASEALMGCQGRIMSMALIHENLYRSENLTEIKFKQYADFLVKNIFHTYKIKSEHFKVNIETDDIFLNIDTAIPCGLIINELVTNSLKHAFPEDEQGELTIKIEQDEDEYYLTVADNGIGLPPEIDINNTTTLGLLLVNSLVGQLEGELDVKRDQGTTFTISFKKMKYPDRIP
jgi:PAS domain S-box-containing protein